MGDGQKKIGFVDSFMAYNVNISSPDASAKWNLLAEYVKQQSPHLVNKYNNSYNISDITYFVQQKNAPDALFQFSKKLQSLIQANLSSAKDDEVVLAIVKKLADVAKSSYDKRVIDLASSMVDTLISNQG